MVSFYLRPCGRNFHRGYCFLQRRQWHSTPVCLLGKSHGWRSLVGCSPWDHKVGHGWATSLSLFTLMHWRRKWEPTPVFLPGESQGQKSLVGCISGVAQSRTRLKWLSSSSRTGVVVLQRMMEEREERMKSTWKGWLDQGPFLGWLGTVLVLETVVWRAKRSLGNFVCLIKFFL